MHVFYDKSHKYRTVVTGSEMRAEDAADKGHGRPYEKFKEAFDAMSGVCYRDKEGNEYTYNDLLAYTRTEKATSELFQILDGSSPEKVLEDSLSFKQCKKCGTWMYNRFFFRTKDMGQILCLSCTPLRTNGRIELWKDPYDDDRRFYCKKEARFEPGITTLVGCNGIGKTTLLNNIEEVLKERGTPYVNFNNLGEEGGEKRGTTLLHEMLREVGSPRQGDESAQANFGLYVSSSEGEKIVSALSGFTKKIQTMINKYAGYGEAWLLFDAIDSGLSLDMIQDVKDYMLAPLDELKNRLNIYIIISSNSYEMSEGTKCFSVEKMKYIPVRSYNAYKKAVLSSRGYKKARDDVFRVKAEIAERPCSTTVNEELWLETEKSDVSKIEGDVLEMELHPFKFILHIKKQDYWTEASCFLFRKEGEDWKKINCRDLEDEPSSRFECLDETREDIHRYLCQKVFKYEKQRRKKKSMTHD